LHSTKWSDGKRKKGWKPFSPPNNLIQDSKGNEENRSPVPDSSKTKISYIKEHNDAHKNILKDEILQVITENFMEMINQNI
jgi:ribonuclease HI